MINQDKSGVFFDMDATGTVNGVSWIGPTDGFLARDRNGNGEIDDASELFSSVTDSESRTGFEALAAFDTDGNGRIDADDDVFDTLLVWQDLNSDGHAQPGELQPLAHYNIIALPIT